MKIELSDEKIKRMADAIDTLRRIEPFTAEAPTAVMAKDTRGYAQYPCATQEELDIYRAACLQASAAALAAIRTRLRAIADGQD